MGGGPTLPNQAEPSAATPLESEDFLDRSIDDLMSIHSDDMVEITHPMLPTPNEHSPSLISPQDEPVVILDHPDSEHEQANKSDSQSSIQHYKLRWSKSKVYVHPTAFLSDNLAGYLGITQRVSKTRRPPNHPSALVFQNNIEQPLLQAPGSFYLSWLPEHAVEVSPERDCWVKIELDPHQANDNALVTVPPEPLTSSIPNYAFSVPINSIHSVILRPPTLSSWHGTTREVRSSQGYTSPLPSSWGGEALLTQLRIFSDICPSIRQQGLFLVNPSQSERYEHSTPIFSDDALFDPQAPPSRTSILHESLNIVSGHGQSGSMDEFTFNILNQFSRLTQNARSAAQMVLSHRLAKPIIPHLPQPIASLANGEPEFIKWSQQAGVEGYDAARVYLAKWACIVAAQGERVRRAEVGDWDVEPSADDEHANILGGGFEMVHATYQVPKVRSNRAPNHPIQLTEFLAWKDDSGKLLLDEMEGKRRIFQRGVAEDARKEVWVFLLGVFDWQSNSQQREKKKQEMSDEYQKLRNSWENDEERKSTSEFQEEAHRIDIDCRRTDRTQPYFAATTASSSGVDQSPPSPNSNMPRSNFHIETLGKLLMTYNVWEKDLGYVQGMSDLCSPLYIVFEGDQVLTYFAFVKLMDRMSFSPGSECGFYLGALEPSNKELIPLSHNPVPELQGMKDELSRLQQLLLLIDPQLYRHFEKTNSLNLFFCFRWILINFKREFEFEDVLKVWEAMWTNVCGPHSDLFLALAVLQSHREPMIRYLREFDEVLKYVNDIAMTLDCEELLGKAEILYLTFKSILETRSTPLSDGLKVIQNGKQTIAITEELKSLL